MGMVPPPLTAWHLAVKVQGLSLCLAGCSCTTYIYILGGHFTQPGQGRSLEKGAGNTAFCLTCACSRLLHGKSLNTGRSMMY